MVLLGKLGITRYLSMIGNSVCSVLGKIPSNTELFEWVVWLGTSLVGVKKLHSTAFRPRQSLTGGQNGHIRLIFDCADQIVSVGFFIIVLACSGEEL